jgi:glucose-6-phosphate dehydrogenase assembly protein OpcA
MEAAVSAGLHPAGVLDRAEKELRALWAAPPAPGQVPKTRACTMNLVVVVPGSSLERWVAIVDDVLQGLPARAIVVGLDPDGEDDLDAGVSAVCTPGGGMVVCSERVTLRVGGAVCARVASCVDALSVADVPSTLVWPARVRVEDPAFAPLARWSQRVVLEASNGSLSSLAHLLLWARGRPDGERPGVAELSWTRLAPWQELCARMFDDARARPLANAVARVRLVQASSSGALLAPEAALMLGWLASRLGWKASSLAGKLRLLRADGGHIQVELLADAVGGAPRGTLLAVEIEASAGDLALRGEVSRVGGEGTGVWRLELKSGGSGGDTRRVEQRVRTFADEPAGTLERTLRRPARDDALAESVAWADELGGDEMVCC